MGFCGSVAATMFSPNVSVINYHGKSVQSKHCRYYTISFNNEEWIELAVIFYCPGVTSFEELSGRWHFTEEEISQIWWLIGLDE